MLAVVKRGWKVFVAAQAGSILLRCEESLGEGYKSCLSGNMYWKRIFSGVDTDCSELLIRD